MVIFYKLCIVLNYLEVRSHSFLSFPLAHSQALALSFSFLRGEVTLLPRLTPDSQP